MSRSTDELLRHNGYTGSVEVSLEDGCLHGRLLHIDDVITYEGNTIAELQADFSRAVDTYVAHCLSIGKGPNRPYTGSFNVRLGAERHRWLAEHATATRRSINETMCAAVDALQVAQGPTAGQVAAVHAVFAAAAAVAAVGRQAAAYSATSTSRSAHVQPLGHVHRATELATKTANRYVLN